MRTTRFVPLALATALAAGLSLAGAAPARSAAPDAIVPAAAPAASDTVSIGMVRTGGSVVFSGTASPVVAGRLFTLQVKDGKSWTDLVGGVAETDAGALTATVDFAGKHSYRWLGEALPDAPAVASRTFVLSGPATLGTNVIYVTTDDGTIPSVKGQVHTGGATLAAGTRSPAPCYSRRSRCAATRPLPIPSGRSS
jgi:hypothetical protein